MAGLPRALGFLRRIAGLTPPSVDADSTGVFSDCPRCGRCVDSRVTRCPDDGTVLEQSSLLPQVIQRRYRFERLLGHGGMGSVYRGRDLALGRAVAIKVIRHAGLADAAASQRLLREAATLSLVRHPSIVAIWDYGALHNGFPYLVMELVSGHDLRDELARVGRIDPERAGRILSAVCDAMSAAHAQGVLHGDLKPENVLLPDHGVEAKVLDFGLARAIGAETGGEERVVDAGTHQPIAGTPAYMAPEQLRGEPPDVRTDVFSLGVIAYEMLIGDLPFGGGPLAEVMLTHARGLPAAVDTLPPALSRAVHAALALDPDRRPPSAQALAYLMGAATGAR